MKCNLKQPLVFFALGAVTVFIVAACFFYAENAENRMFSKSDFEGCELYLTNERNLLRVERKADQTDVDFRNQVIEILTHAKKFRPRASTEILLGGAYVSASFRGETGGFSVSFYYATEQLATDYIYREEPIIATSVPNATDTEVTYSAWYCSLPPADYARLYTLLQTYNGGEVI